MTYGTLTEHRSAANDSGLESVLLFDTVFLEDFLQVKRFEERSC